jgi:hypothetical protein
VPTLSPAIAAAVGVFVGLLLCILPTFLYLYVEPRGRPQWGGDAGPRRAPALVHLAAWSSFAVGQIAIPSLLVPAACVALEVIQVKLGIVHPGGYVAAAAVGALALAQALLSLGLIPAGVRVLMNDTRAMARVLRFARNRAIGAGAILSTALSLGWSMDSLPGLVHPWLRAALVWAALRPVELFAAASLLQAVLLWQAVRIATPARESAPERGEERQ